MSGLTEKQRKMMQHALGYGHPRMEPGWRNRYIVGLSCPAGEAWQDLVARGYADDGGELNDSQGSHFFHVTDEGRRVLEGAT